jgi:seryl-tRNA synthetase
MLDIQFIRDNAELVQKKSAEKGYKTVDVAQLLELDAERRSKLTQLEELRARRNQLSDTMKGQKPTPEQLEQG